MNLIPIENLGGINSGEAKQTPANEVALRQAAKEFEALLLTQLTAALNNANEAEEDSLFGQDGGTDLSKKMFSEQLAKTMAESGGIGLQDVILRQFGINQPNNFPNNNRQFAKPIEAIKEIKETAIQAIKNIEEKSLEPTRKNERITLDKPIKPIVKIDSDQPSVPVSVKSISENVGITDSGGYQMPAKGRISSGFGNRFHPIDKVIKFHAGIDIAVPIGTKVTASASGVVTHAGWKKGYGNLVIVRHNDGKETYYGHLSKITVKENEQVSKGQQVALSGSTGKSTGPHLHFEVRENGVVVNPLKILSNVLSKTTDK